MTIMKRLIYLTLIITVTLTLSCDNQVCAGDKEKKSVGNEVHTHPKNIILMIGDGMGLSAISAAMTVQKDLLNIARCNYTGFIKTSSLNQYITDSGAAGTALATGKKTNNLHVSVDPEGDPFTTILEIAEEHSLSTGLIATSSITHATPASFIAYNTDRSNYEALALDFLKTDIDVFIGGGKDHFSNRVDGLNLLDSLLANDYQLVFDVIGLAGIEKGKVAGLLYDEHPPKFSEGRGNMLGIATDKTLEILKTNENGFFLMIEGSQIDWAAHENNTEYMIEETIDFDNVIGTVLDFAENNKETLVIITSDHETGGFAINGGDREQGEVIGAFTSGGHTATMVPVFAFGPGAEQFTGIYDNTEIFNKCMKAFGFDKTEK